MPQATNLGDGREDMGALSGSRPTDGAASVSTKGFDPARKTDHLPDIWQTLLAEAVEVAKREAQNGVWTISGNYADCLGTVAMQAVADRTGFTVIPVGESDFHAGRTFAPSKARGQ